MTVPPVLTGKAAIRAYLYVVITAGKSYITHVRRGMDLYDIGLLAVILLVDVALTLRTFFDETVSRERVQQATDALDNDTVAALAGQPAGTQLVTTAASVAVVAPPVPEKPAAP